ncbi:MAG TPA: FtsX-like permease family protein [Acidimicrobiales bacterium]
MRKVALRGLLAHKLRMLATLVAVALGVAFVGGVLTMTDTMNRSLDDLFASAYEGTDAIVRSERTIDSEFDEGMGLRAKVDDDLAEQVRSVDEVADADVTVEGYARLVGPDGEPVGNPAFGPPTLGANWVENDELNPFNLREGRAPEAPGEIVMDAASAESTGYRIGDSVPVQSENVAEEFTVVGIAGFGTADSPAGSSYVLFTRDEAQRVVGEAGRANDVLAVGEPGTTQAQVRDAVAAVAPDGTEVLTGAEITEESQSDLREALSFLTLIFVPFAVVAVVVGAFVIYNTFSITVAQRTREMALLRAVGASRRQVRRAVLIEAIAVGVVGSAAGFVLGLGLASIFVRLLGLIDTSLILTPGAVITALVVGVVVTVASALVPARRASKVPPLAAMREVAVDTSGRSLLRLVAGAAVTGLGGAIVVVGVATEELASMGAGLGAVFLGLLLLGPTLARPVGRLVGAPLARLRGTPGVLARNNAVRNPRRSASTAQALMIGVGIVAFFLVINASLRASIDETLDESFRGDFVVDSGTFGLVGLPPEVADRVAEQPDVDVVAPFRFVPVEVGGEGTAVVGTDPGAFGLLDTRIVQGDGDLASGEVVVESDTAEDEGLAVGDRVTVDFLETGERSLTVAGIYEPVSSTGPTMGDYVVGLEEISAAAPTATDTQVFVGLTEGADPAAVEPELERIVEPFATAEVQSVDEFRDMIAGQLDFVLLFVLGLLGVAIIIALLGIANTIALSVIERTREIGVLRAVGMGRGQLRSAIRWEAVIISVFGTVLGLAFGLLGGWALFQAMPADEGFSAFDVPVGLLVVVAVVAGALGMLAALWPAWRASRLNPLEAIHAE